MDIRKKSHYSLGVESILRSLQNINQNTYLYSFSALDKLFLKQAPPAVFAATTASLIDLAKIFPTLDFPGMEDIDASFQIGGSTVYFRSLDTLDELPGNRLLPLSFLYDVHRSIFINRNDVYFALRNKQICLSSGFRYPFTWMEIAEIGVLLARYHYEMPRHAATFGEPVSPPPPEKQRILLSHILTGQNSAEGLRLLEQSGFLSRHWPELSGLMKIEQAKEFHPEGNVWEHTLASVSQRKSLDLPLALGLLLHDIGKAGSYQYEGNRFYQHAQIGSHSAVQFLRRLGFPDEIVEDVRYLVQYHMLPAAVEKLPLYKTEHILSSPLFPALLELFRCDLASSSRNLSKYYDACKFYRRFMKNRKNPFRKKGHYQALVPKSV